MYYEKCVYSLIRGYGVNYGANSYACNINQYSKDEKVLEALKILNNIKAEEVFDNLSENDVKIIFYDLSIIDTNYSKDYAISSIDAMGNRFILLNSKYKNSSNESIACLIVHESFHKLKRVTFSEEVRCTKKEAEYWHRLKKQSSPEIANDLIIRLNKLERLYITSSNTNDKIAESILNNQFYKNQIAMR